MSGDDCDELLRELKGRGLSLPSEVAVADMMRGLLTRSKWVIVKGLPGDMVATCAN